MQTDPAVLPASARDHADVRGRRAYGREHVRRDALVISRWSVLPISSSSSRRAGECSRLGRVAALTEGPLDGGAGGRASV